MALIDTLPPAAGTENEIGNRALNAPVSVNLLMLVSETPNVTFDGMF